MLHYILLLVINLNANAGLPYSVKDLTGAKITVVQDILIPMLKTQSEKLGTLNWVRSYPSQDAMECAAGLLAFCGLESEYEENIEMSCRLQAFEPSDQDRILPSGREFTITHVIPKDCAGPASVGIYLGGSNAINKICCAGLNVNSQEVMTSKQLQQVLRSFMIFKERPALIIDN